MEAKIGVEYDESALKALIANLDCMKEENQTEPVNAHPEFQNDKFVVIPETDGTKIDTDTFMGKSNHCCRWIECGAGSFERRLLL